MNPTDCFQYEKMKRLMPQNLLQASFPKNDVRKDVPSNKMGNKQKYFPKGENRLLPVKNITRQHQKGGSKKRQSRKRNGGSKGKYDRDILKKKITKEYCSYKRRCNFRFLEALYRIFLICSPCLAMEKSYQADENLKIQFPTVIKFHEDVTITCYSRTACSTVNSWLMKAPDGKWTTLSRRNSTYISKYQAVTNAIRNSLLIRNFSYEDFCSTYRCECDSYEHLMKFTDKGTELRVIPEVYPPFFKKDNSTIQVKLNVQNIYQKIECTFFIDDIKIQNVSQIMTQTRYQQLNSVEYRGHHEYSHAKCNMNVTVNCSTRGTEMFYYNSTIEETLCKASKNADADGPDLIAITITAVLVLIVVILTVVVVVVKFLRKNRCCFVLKKPEYQGVSQDTNP